MVNTLTGNSIPVIVWLPWHVPRQHIDWGSSHCWAGIFFCIQVIWLTLQLVKIVTPSSTGFLTGPQQDSVIERQRRQRSLIIILYCCMTGKFGNSVDHYVINYLQLGKSHNHHQCYSIFSEPNFSTIIIILYSGF